MNVVGLFLAVGCRLGLEEERDSLRAECLRSQSSAAELRTQLEQGSNGNDIDVGGGGENTRDGFHFPKQISKGNCRPLQKQKSIQFQNWPSHVS